MYAHTHTQIETDNHTHYNQPNGTLISAAAWAWLPNENKGCMYSADTHHQSQIACGHNDYLLYVNPLSNKAGYPLMRRRCYYCGQDIASKCHWPTANNWLCPIETWWRNWKMVISGAEVTQIFRQFRWWLCVLSSFAGAGKGLTVLGKQGIFSRETTYSC